MMDSVRKSARALSLAGLAAVPSVALAAEGEAKGEGGLPQLDISTFPSQVFWLIISFAVLYVVMAKIAVPRIAEVLEERQERIADDLETAERLRAEAEDVRQDYERTLAQTHTDAATLIRDTQAVIGQEQAAAEAEAAKKVARRVKTAETRIAKQKDEALESLKTVASDAATEATQRLIGVTPKDAAVAKAVEAAMAAGDD